MTGHPYATVASNDSAEIKWHRSLADAEREAAYDVEGGVRTVFIFEHIGTAQRTVKVEKFERNGTVKP